MDDTWRRLAAQQAGLVARRQLNQLGITHQHVRRRVEAGRWVVHSPLVVGTTTGTLDVEHRRWLAVLHAGPGSALGELSAAEVHGLTGWKRAEVTVLVSANTKAEPVPGVRIRRTRRDLASLTQTRQGLPVLRLEPAVPLFAAREPVERTGCGALAAFVQQRLTTADRLAEGLAALTPIRRVALLGGVLGDISGGAQSLAEIDVGGLCARHDLEAPHRQHERADHRGRRRWLDCEWDLPSGQTVVLEVDGSFHMEVVQWNDDIARQRGLTSLTRVLVRCTALELRLEPDRVAADLALIGIPGRGSQAATQGGLGPTTSTAG